MSSATVAEGAAIWDTSTTETSTMAETGFARLLGFGLGLLLYPTPLGDSTIPAEMRKMDEHTGASVSDIAVSQTCRGMESKSCSQNKHSGRIQAQEDKITYIPASIAGSAWTDLPRPPSLHQCKGFADNCRNALNNDRLSGKDYGKQFHKGADIAVRNMKVWMEKVSPMGVSAYPTTFKLSFYFNGKRGAINKADTSLKGKDSRRMDFDVLKGEALKG